MKYFALPVIIFLFLYSCKSNNPVTSNNETAPSDYTKIDSVQSGNWKFEIWSATSSSLNYGYNDLGFKVFNSGTEMKTGYVKYTPVMTHTGVAGHSSPVSPLFNFNTDKNLFTGYVCYTMYSDSISIWKASYDYNGIEKLDSIPFYVNYNLQDNIKIWTDISGGHTYVLSLIKPTSPALGLNVFSVILHRTDDDINYTEVDGASMGIYVLMVTHGHSSSNNINPVTSGSGKYTGQVNFTMSGKWAVYDTIKVAGNDITNNNPPKFNFAVQ